MSMRKVVILLIIILVIGSISIFPKSLNEAFYGTDNPLSPYLDKYGFIAITEEDTTNPTIVANIMSTRDPYSVSNREGLNLFLKDLIAIAKIIDNVKTASDEKYENIYISSRYAFLSNFVLDYKNSTFYIPTFYSDIAHLLTTYHTDNENQLLSNKESFDYLYYNGFLTSDKRKFEFMGNNKIGTGYSAYVVNGIFKSYDKELSKAIRIDLNNPKLRDSDLITKARKSYWGEGDWLVSKRFDDFSDDPIYQISQITSSTYDSANVWLMVRYSKRKNLEIIIDFSTNVRLSEPIHVTYRIDGKDTIYDEKWLSSTSKTATFYPFSAKNLVTELMDSNKAVFLVKSRDQQYKFEIDTNGLKKTLEPYMDTFELR